MSKLKMLVQKGPIKVNKHWIEAGAVESGFLAIGIDLKSKHAALSGVLYSDKDPCEIYLVADEDTTNLDKNYDPQDTSTVLSFPELKDWTVWASSIARYTLRVCLLSPRFPL